MSKSAIIESCGGTEVGFGITFGSAVFWLSAAELLKNIKINLNFTGLKN